MASTQLADTLASFGWSNEPTVRWHDDALEIITEPDTDYWQRTHYGFRRDNGHFLFTPMGGDFCLTARVAFLPNAQYDQCGLMCRANADAWIKASIEYEPEGPSRLGSVVTNLGYSDWATQNVKASIDRMSYRISRSGDDFRIESAYEGGAWQQMRVAHLHDCPDVLDVGFYACSPVGAGFTCQLLDLAYGVSG